MSLPLSLPCITTISATYCILQNHNTSRHTKHKHYTSINSFINKPTMHNQPYNTMYTLVFKSTLHIKHMHTFISQHLQNNHSPMPYLCSLHHVVINNQQAYGILFHPTLLLLCDDNICNIINMKSTQHEITTYESKLFTSKA